MNTQEDRIKTKAEAEITSSDTKLYTVSVKVTELDNDNPVPKGKVVITSKKGKIVGTGKIKDGTADITASITSKDYLLTISYEGTARKYAESCTKIDFQSEYLFYKTSFYLWTALIGILIVIAYIILLNTYIFNTAPATAFTSYLQQIIPYISTTSVTQVIVQSNYIYYIINTLVWILIISFIVASIYAMQFNSNLHNIIRKNVTNHSLFQNFFIYIIEILMVITVLAVII